MEKIIAIDENLKNIIKYYQNNNYFIVLQYIIHYIILY